MLYPIALLLMAAVQEEAPVESLNLICDGSGVSRERAVSQGYATGSDGGSATATVTRSYDRDFADLVNVEVRGNEGRIRVPRTMLPTFHGGNDGWFRLSNLRITADEITAKASVNFMNRPNVRIDRIAGTITISGAAGHFSGQCEAYDPATVRRRF